MTCECSDLNPESDAEKSILRQALFLNALMFVIGVLAGYAAQSTSILADAADMLTDAFSYWLALIAIRKGFVFKHNAARWIGLIMILLSLGILVEVVRRWYFGSEPVGMIMMIYSLVSFAVNFYVLSKLAKLKDGEVHLRATYICTRADVIANFAVFISGAVVYYSGQKAIDLIVGLLIGLYVLKESLEILYEKAD